MKKYRIVPESESNRWCNHIIWVDGQRSYFDSLAQAFPGEHLDFFPDAGTERYTWYARISSPGNGTLSELDSCLHAFRRTLWVETALDACFALGWHSKPGAPGKPALTTLGQWVHMAKSYGTDSYSSGSHPVADLIADQMAEFVRRHPLYRSCDGIIAVLPSNPEKVFDLPTSLAEFLAEDSGIPFLRDVIYKVRLTAQMKFCPTLEDKLDNVSGSIGVNPEKVRGKRLLIVDDIIESGVTLAETARSLREAGVAETFGLAVTKTLKRKF